MNNEVTAADLPKEEKGAAADDLVFGLLDNSAAIGCAATADRLRDLTISWSRYSYGGPMIEADNVDDLLAAATEQGYRYCFVQAYGHVIAERWSVDGGGDILASLKAWIETHDFLVAGALARGQWYGLAARYMLVDLARYAVLGRPYFGAAARRSVQVPRVAAVAPEGRMDLLQPLPGSEELKPDLPGWHLVAASLAEQLPVCDLGAVLARHSLDLAAASPAQRRHFGGYFADGIAAYGGADGELSPDQDEFLAMVDSQVKNARRGVFLWNIEPYDDVEIPSDQPRGPVTSLYCVAAGFKPNRILQVQGMDPSTRVVFFDYSAAALTVRQTLLAEWDGEDFPRFVRYLFERFPHPRTFYQLWAGLAPGQLDWADVERVWQGELQRWGGAAAFKAHWAAYRHLSHHFVHCDIMADPAALYRHIKPEANGIIWFSNAFFTVLSNWRLSSAQRHQIYRRWIERLARLNPDLLLYGSDCGNSNVNCIRAATYWQRYQQMGGDPLVPPRLGRLHIRM